MYCIHLVFLQMIVFNVFNLICATINNNLSCCLLIWVSDCHAITVQSTTMQQWIEQKCFMSPPTQYRLIWETVFTGQCDYLD